jgi:hypothetical protein
MFVDIYFSVLNSLHIQFYMHVASHYLSSNVLPWRQYQQHRHPKYNFMTHCDHVRTYNNKKYQQCTPESNIFIV